MVTESQELYHLKLTFEQGENLSDTQLVRFGIREITYELSLLDETGHLRRVEIDPTRGKEGVAGVVDVTHEGMRAIPAADPFPPSFPEEWRANWRSWVASLAPGAESSPAVRAMQRYGAGALSGDQGEWRANRVPRRQLGHGRFAEARLARSAWSLISACTTTRM